MNKIKSTILNKGGDVLNVYFTAGFPNLESICPIIRALDNAGVDIVELGMPYSDPMADGTTIQESSAIALRNGLNLQLLFDKVLEARENSDIPIIMMGYFNQLLQYGVEAFLEKAASCGVDGMIIPDLPMDIYESEYKAIFEKYDLSISFLITPLTSDARVRKAAELSTAFIYVVSSSSITGKSGNISDAQKSYFQRISSMNLASPSLIGFGIHDKTTYETACTYSHGAIVGSAFIRALRNAESIERSVESFIKSIRN